MPSPLCVRLRHDLPPAYRETSAILPPTLRQSPKLFFLPSKQRPFRLIRVSASVSTAKTLPDSVIRRISDKLRSLGYLDDQLFSKERPPPPPTSSAAGGEIFIPVPRELPKHRVGHTLDPSWSTPEHPIPGPGSGTAITKFHLLRREADGQRKNKGTTPEAVVPISELMIPPQELRRLRTEGIRLDKKIKVGKAGITEGIVNGIHERWRKAEVVKIKCDDLCRMNMKRTHEILERKTGGLVVWRSGSIIILYRGVNYKYPYFVKSSEEDGEMPSVPVFDDINNSKQDSDMRTAAKCSSHSSDRPVCQSLVSGVGSPMKVRLQLPGEALVEEEANRLLDGLGPRFIDWWGCEPLPVDADLLPATVAGFRRPLRLLPYGVKPKLTDREMTILRRLSRPLPCHFALGRNRNIQGLAASMIKLWEKCEIAKIAIKRGVQNTNSELMVEELKRLTGGTLLSRDKEFITFYRGKDFLPPAVSKAIAERRDGGIYHMNHWKNKIASNGSISPPVKDHARASLESVHETNTQEISFPVGRSRSFSKSAETDDAMLSKAHENKMKAEMLLEKIEQSAGPLEQESDKEAISDEERFMLRKVGLRMRPFLLLGRRGVFDGTVENMHLHWKYRELVKIIAKSRSIEDVHRTARALEAASGGILVAVEKVNKGHAIIVYRGKNYRRPKALRPKELLTKKQALKRYVEHQRCESLRLHVLKLSREAKLLKNEVPQMQEDCQADALQPNKSRNVSDNELDFSASKMDQLKSPCNLDSAKTDISSGNENVFSEEKDVQLDIDHPPCYGKNTSYVADKREGMPTSTISNFSEDLFPGVAQNKHVSSDHQVENENDHGPSISIKDSTLTNKERLILRKQALQMKKRPVLSVGKSNAIDGVAKTVRTHFRKHPLAIINIKNIAKGTSVQEVVFELERATGSVLVSREPNKVILYRGWGVGEKKPDVQKEKCISVRRHTPSHVEQLPDELVTAIKIECGMHSSERETTDKMQ